MSSAIQLNGAPYPWHSGTVRDLLAERDGPRGIAIAVNGVVVPRPSWPHTPVRPGDQVEVVTAVQGG